MSPVALCLSLVLEDGEVTSAPAAGPLCIGHGVAPFSTFAASHIAGWGLKQNSQYLQDSAPKSQEVASFLDN